MKKCKSNYKCADSSLFGRRWNDEVQGTGTTIVRNGVNITFDEYGRITNDIRQIENVVEILDMDANTQTSNLDFK